MVESIFLYWKDYLCTPYVTQSIKNKTKEANLSKHKNIKIHLNYKDPSQHKMFGWYWNCLKTPNVYIWCTFYFFSLWLFLKVFVLTTHKFWQLFKDSISFKKKKKKKYQILKYFKSKPIKYALETKCWCLNHLWRKRVIFSWSYERNLHSKVNLLLCSDNLDKLFI